MAYGEGRIIAVDLDGTCVKYIDAIRRELAECRGVTEDEIPPVTKYSLVESGWFDTVEDYQRFHARCVEKGLYARLEPIEGAKEGLWALHRAGWHIHYLTDRFVVAGQGHRVCTDTVESLDRNGFPMDAITFADDKRMVLADLFVDDAPPNIEKLRLANRRCLCFDQPYNRDVAAPRARSWEEVVSFCEREFGDAEPDYAVQGYVSRKFPNGHVWTDVVPSSQR